MKFVVPYPFGNTLDQAFANQRELINSLNDGNHDVIIASASFNSAAMINATITSASITYGNILNASITSGNFTTANFTSASFTGASIGSATIQNLIATDGIITSATISILGTLASANITRISSVNNLAVTSGNFTSAVIGSATITRMSSPNIVVTSGNFTSAVIGSATITRLSSPNIAITSANITSAYIGSATITRMSATDGFFTSASITSATISSATITGATIGTLQGLIKGSTGVLGTFGTGTIVQWLRGDQTWVTPAGGGDIVGPASSVDNTLARFDSTTGKLLQTSVISVSDAGIMSGISELQVTSNAIIGGLTANRALKADTSNILTSMDAPHHDNLATTLLQNSAIAETAIINRTPGVSGMFNIIGQVTIKQTSGPCVGVARIKYGGATYASGTSIAYGMCRNDSQYGGSYSTVTIQKLVSLASSDAVWLGAAISTLGTVTGTYSIAGDDAQVGATSLSIIQVA